MGKKDELEDDMSEEEMDEDSDFDEEDEDSEDMPKKKSKKKAVTKKKEKAPSRKRSRKDARPAKEEEEEEMDDEDDEEEEEEEKPQKKSRGSRFIDDMADVDEDEDDEDDEGEGAEDLIDDEGVAGDEAGPSHRAADNYRLLNRKIEAEGGEKTAEEIAAYIENKYKNYGGDEDEAAGDDAVGQQGLQPTKNDPKLWIVTVRPGREREACIQLLQKFYTFASKAADGSAAPLLIKSAVALDHLKGYIYVEAEKQSHVADAVRGLRTVFMSKEIKMVPVEEMIPAITVNRKAKLSIMRDQWVRVKNGIYKDDLAKVHEVDFATQRATIRLLPRLDLQAMASREEGQAGSSQRLPFGRTPTVRPPAKPFNDDEARQFALAVQTMTAPGGGTYYQLGSYKFVEGYLEKTVAIKSLSMLTGVPPVAEIAKFNSAARQQQLREAGGNQEDAEEGMEGEMKKDEISALLASMPQDASAQKTTYAKGDRIRFSKGELLNLGGTVTGVREDGKIMVHPDIVGFDEDVDCDPDELTKSFFVGDKVMVMSGTHAGETGMLLKLETSGQCSILSDTTKEEITLMLRDLTQNPETDTGVEVLGSYNLHDLVQLDNNTAGVIFKIEREAARVLTSNGTLERPEIRVCREPDMLRKVFSKNTTTTDKNSQRVKVGDFVSIVDGPAAFKGKGGAVEHIFRNSLFIKGRDFSFDHAGGFICVRSRSCVVRGGALSASDVLRASGNPALMGGSGYVPQSPMHPAAGMRPGYAPMSPLSSRASQQGGPQGQLSSMLPPPPRPSTSLLGFMPPPPSSGPASSSAPGSQARPGGFVLRALEGKMVRVMGGAYNGYRGRVKQEMDDFVQVELDATTRIQTIRKDQVRVDGLVPGAMATGGQAPGGGLSGSGFGRSGFPSHTATTAGGGGGGGGGGGYGQTTRTPMHPSMTPMHHQGTGAATPLHPSMHVPYTPMHPGSGASDNQTRGWGGIGAGAKPYVPSSNLPYEQEIPAGGFDLGTPGTAMSHQDPSNKENLAHYEDVLVNILRGEDAGRTALVKEVDAKGRRLVLELGSLDPGSNTWIVEGAASEPCDLSWIEPLPPSKKDKVRLLKDSDLAPAGTEGVVVSIDDNDGIVKVEGTADLLIIDLKHLGRISV